MSTPTTEPTRLRAGDTWTWRRDDLSDYPATTWTLTYWFTNAAANFHFSASAVDTTKFLVTVAKATTAAFAAGTYSWAAFVTDATQRYQVDEGSLIVLPDLGTAANIDGRSHARKVLAAIESLLEGKANADALSYSIAGRALTKYSVEELLRFRNVYRAEVAAESSLAVLSSGGQVPNKLFVRLGS